MPRIGNTTSNAAPDVIGPRLIMLLCVLGLTLLGFVMIYSASSICNGMLASMSLLSAWPSVAYVRLLAPSGAVSSSTYSRTALPSSCFML